MNSLTVSVPGSAGPVGLADGDEGGSAGTTGSNKDEEVYGGRNILLFMFKCVVMLLHISKHFCMVNFFFLFFFNQQQSKFWKTSHKSMTTSDLTRCRPQGGSNRTPLHRKSRVGQTLAGGDTCGSHLSVLINMDYSSRADVRWCRQFLLHVSQVVPLLLSQLCD